MLAATFDKFAQGIGFGWRQCALEIQIQFHARHLEQVREEKFNLQARRLDVFLAEKIRAFLDRFEDGHARSLTTTNRIASVADGRLRFALTMTF